MARKTKRQKAIKRLNLSDHTLDINIRRCNYKKFSFPEIEEYVRELVGSRDYQYDAIKQIMIYLWGSVYPTITELGKENYKQKFQVNFIYKLFTENKFDIKERYKPVYYALLNFMGEKYIDESRKMGPKLKETVDEIINRIKQLEKDYK